MPLSTRRIGGAFGAKISRNNMVTPIAALAASKLNAPVRLALSLSDNMKIVGKRPEFLFAYSAALDGDNKVDTMSVDVVSDAGAQFNASFLLLEFKNLKEIPI